MPQVVCSCRLWVYAPYAYNIAGCMPCLGMWGHGKPWGGAHLEPWRGAFGGCRVHYCNLFDFQCLLAGLGGGAVQQGQGSLPQRG